MNNKAALVLLTIILGLMIIPEHSQAQSAGNIVYSQSGGAKARAEEQIRTLRKTSEPEKLPTGTSSIIEANVLMNVKADEFVAVFSLGEEGETIADCVKKMDVTARDFTAAIKALGIADDDIFLDFVTQTRIYGYEFAGNIAREKLVGFELKKNLSIHYQDHAMIDKLTVAASRSKVFDLIKVDYVVKDSKAVQDKLMEEASKIIKRKVDRSEKFLAIKLQPPAQIFAEKYATFYPTQLYDSYSAAESEQVHVPFDRNQVAIQSVRKGRTSVFNGLDGSLFDEVINPVVLEPVVQFTIHLKIKYEVEQIKAK